MSKVARREYIQIAKELGYPKSVIVAIKHAPDETAIQRILVDARHGLYK